MKRVDPVEIGFSPERLDRIIAFFQRYVDAGKLAGVVNLIARHGQIAHFESIGMMNVDAKKPMQRNTIFRIASMTKPITATSLMLLYEEGLFQLGDPVAEFIPDFKNTQVFLEQTDAGIRTEKAVRPITIRDLLTHSSGIALGAGGTTPLEALYSQEVDKLKQSGVTLRQAVEGIAQLPIAHHPGSAWTYGLSYEVIARLVEILSGSWFDVFLRERLFRPLNMPDTYY